MNLRSIIFGLMLISYALSSAEHNNSFHNTPPTTINITLNTANRADLNQINDLTQNSYHQAIQKTRSFINTDDPYNLYEKFSSFCKEQTDHARNSSISILSWLEHNKIKTGCAALLAMYAYVSIQIYHNNQIINDTNSWSNWNNHILEELLGKPQHLLESDLLFTIQSKYVHPTNPTDFIYSIVQSSISLKQEIQILQDQIWCYERIEQCKCLPLFFIQSQDVEILKNKYRKLLFIQHIFASWCGRYKIDKNN